MTVYEVLKTLGKGSEALPDCHSHAEYMSRRQALIDSFVMHKCHNFMDALRLAIAEHDWRRGYSGPCAPDKKCPTCKLITKLEEVKT